MTQLLLFIALGWSWNLGGPSPSPRIDYGLGMVFWESRIDGYLIGIDEVTSLEEYLLRSRRELIRELWITELGRALRAQEVAGGKGLIPEIRIPVGVPWLGQESKIDITGSERITVGGQQTFLTGNVYRDPTMPRTIWNYLPQPLMEQQLVVRVDGSIGDKLKVTLDHDSQRFTDKDNTVQLRYQGSEDEIIQAVELGNTQLSIPNPGRYVGSLPTHKGLFGLSAGTKLAGLDLYLIASQEQASSQTAKFMGQAEVATDTISDSQFLWGTLFLIPAPGRVKPGSLWVWLDDRVNYNLEGKRGGLAVLDPPDTSSPPYSGDRHEGFFRQLIANQDYRFDYDSNILELLSPLSRDNPSRLPVLGVIYETINDSLVGDTAWGDNGNSLLLQLIAPPQFDTLSQCWELELKNAYRIGPPGIKLEEVRIFRDETGAQDPEKETDGADQGRTFLEILGLDPNRDGRVEYPQFLPDRGWLLFPNLKPFLELSQPDSIIYEKRWLRPGEGNRYYITVKYTKATESFDLGQFGITEETEEVYVNGALWERGKDYRLDYKTGRIIFLRPLPPDAQIEVKYEYTSLFEAFRRSLVGARGELKFAPQGRLGGSIFYRSEGESGEEMPKLGTEPIKRLVGALDLAYEAQPQWITRMIDRLPLITTSAPSRFSISGDLGVSRPDPNTRGYAWLEDFESTIRSQGPTMTSYTEWYYAGWSQALGKDTSKFASTPIRWSNPREAERVRKGDIFGEQIEDADERLSFLRIEYTADDTASWAGVMTGNQAGWNLEDLENLELVLRFSPEGPGRLNIDFGSMYKDAPRRNRAGEIVGLNGRLDTEDRNRNTTLEPDEDRGLDGIAGSDQGWPSIPGDDGNDDFGSENLSGTEGNRRLDSEDLDNSGTLGVDDFYRVTIEMGDERFFKPLKGGFWLVQVPLSDSSLLKRIGNPRIEAVPLIRLWLDGFEPGAHRLEIVSFEFKGVIWRNKGVVPSTPSAPPIDTTERFETYPVSNRTDPAYTSPFRVSRDPMSGALEEEAALELRFTDLRPEHLGLLEHYDTQKKDYREYKSIRVYLHPDPQDPTFFLRLGTDSLSYYEYQARASQGRPVPYGEGWYELTIELDSFPALKAQAIDKKVPKLSSGGYTVQAESLPNQIRYPSLAEICYLGLGVENSDPGSITGKLWVNDLRLAQPRRDLGYAHQVSIGLTLADLAQVNLGLSHQDPNFRTFSDPRGVRQSSRIDNQNLSVSLNLHKLLPAGLKLNLPFQYRLNQDRSRPKYSNYINDLLVPGEAEAGGSSSQSLSLSLSKGRSQNPLLNYSLDALSLSLQGSRATSHGEMSRDSTDQSTSQINYRINPDLGFNLLGTRISYFPQGLNLSATRSQSKSGRWSRTSRDSVWTPTLHQTLDALTPSIGIRYSPHQLLQTNFSRNSTRDLRNPKEGVRPHWGEEIGCNQDLGLSLNLPIARIVTPSFGYTGHYDEAKPEDADFLNLDNRAVVRTGGKIEISTLMGLLTHLRDETRDSLARFGSLHWIACKLEEVGARFAPLDLSYTRTRSSSYQGVFERPDQSYQWGLTDSLADTLYTGSGSRARQEVYSAGSGIRWGSLDLGIGYEYSVSQNLYYQNNTQTSNVTWPRLSLKIGGIERWLHWFSSSSFNSQLNISQDQSGLMEAPPDRKNYSFNLAPLLGWQGRLRSGLMLQLSLNHSESRSEIVGTSTTERDQQDLQFGSSYAFSAPGGLPIPGLKRIRFRSDLNLGGSLTYSKSQQLLHSRLQAEPIPIASDQNLRTQLSANYTFSQAIDGGLDLSYLLWENRLSGIQSHNPQLNFWVLFKF